MDKKQKTTLTIITIIGIILIILSTQSDKEIVSIEGGWDISNDVNEMALTEFLVEETDFDYSDPVITNLAQTIKSQTTNPEDAIKQTIKYVANNIRYDGSVSVSYCYSEKASDVLATGSGDCVSMSRLVTALLRAQGIPSRTMGGCLSIAKRCDILFSVIPGAEPQTTDMEEGDFKKRGFLHEYVEAWTPDQGWIRIEATSGQVFPLDCDVYLDYKYDSNKFNRCVIQDNSFWKECRSY